jgi:hypothetical protein
MLAKGLDAVDEMLDHLLVHLVAQHGVILHKLPTEVNRFIEKSVQYSTAIS